MKLKTKTEQYSRFLIYGFLFVTVAFISIRCQKWIKPENDTQISKHGDDESHYTGDNCMNCHYTEGRGEGWFLVGGSAAGNYQNANVHLYNDFNEAPIATIQVDGYGNFYTTEDIDFSNGLLVSIQKQGGQEQEMEARIFNGQCNLCHGVTTAKIDV